MSLFDLSGKVAVVTGSSRGIGRAVAERLAEAGASVVISSRDPQRCEEVATAIRAKGGTAIIIPCHIGERGAVEALISGTVTEYGGLDILVCNAASNPAFGPMAELSDAAFDKIIQNNVKSNLWLANLAAPHMVTRGGGAIILMSSIAGLRGNTHIGMYGISKAADMQLVRNLAVEWGRHNIRANCIAPGLVKTDFARALWEDEGRLKRAERHAPLGRIGDPDDIAGIAVFLAAPAGRFVTGQTIVADGGVTISDTL